MSQNIKQFISGIGLEPVSADPASPVQGQLQYADGTVRAEGLWRYDGTAWQQVGSGAGSYDIFYQENLETNTSSTFTTGLNATPDAAGTGTLGGTLEDEESLQINGDRSLKYTMNATAASSDNDFFLNDTDIALSVKQQGQFIGISFYYTYNGADDDIRFFVLDQDDNELTQSDEYIKSSSTATRFSTSVFVPSDDTALRYGFQVVTGNSSKVFIVDDIEFTTNPFVYKNLAEENVFSAKISQSDVVSDENAPFIDSVSSPSTGIYTVTFLSGFFSVTPNIILQPRNDDRIAYITSQSSTGFTYQIINSSDVLLNDAVNVVVQKQGADYRAPAEHVVTPAKSNPTNWESYTPTYVGITSSSEDVSYRIIGDSVEIQGKIVVGSSSATELRIPLPSSYTAKVTLTQAVGVYFRNSSGGVAPNKGGPILVNIDEGYATFGSFATLSGSNANYESTINGNSFASGDEVSFFFRVPVNELTGVATFLAAVPMNYSQTKLLSADITSDTTMADLTFNNLVIGKRYEFRIQSFFDTTGSVGSSAPEIQITHNSSVIGLLQYDPPSTDQGGGFTATTTGEFTATASTLTFVTSDVDSNGAIRGNNTRSETYAQLKELNYTKETTRFT